MNKLIEAFLKDTNDTKAKTKLQNYFNKHMMASSMLLPEQQKQLQEFGLQL